MMHNPHRDHYFTVFFGQEVAMRVFFYIPVRFLFEDLNTSHFNVRLWECVFFFYTNLGKMFLFDVPFFFFLMFYSKPEQQVTQQLVPRLKKGSVPFMYRTMH